MAATGKNKMKAKLKVEAWEEMKPKQKQWVLSNPALKKAFKPIEYSEDMMLDPRKWDERKLADGMKAIVRYELKLLDMAVFRWQKEAEKKGPLAQQKAEKDLPALYAKMVKTIQDKLSVALDEVASDLGDNKKGLKGSKELLDRLKGVKLQAMFVNAGTGVHVVYANLAAALKSDDMSDKEKSAAYSDALKQLDKVMDTYRDESTIDQIFDDMIKLGDNIVKNKDANPKLTNFGKEVQGFKSEFVDINKAIYQGWEAFDKTQDVIEGQINRDDAKRKSMGSKVWAGLGKSGKRAETTIAKLRKQFDPIYKELKK
jgi:hypothetical protein